MSRQRKHAKEGSQQQENNAGDQTLVKRCPPR
jgi:hypothetical protein